MQTCTVINNGKQKLTVIAYHNDVCIKTGHCLCVGGFPSTVHLPAGIATKKVNTAFLKSRDLKNPINEGTVKVMELKDVEESKEPGKKSDKKSGKKSGKRTNR